MVSVAEATVGPASALGQGIVHSAETDLGVYQIYITSILMLEERRSHSSSIFASVIAACVGAGGIADLQLVPLAIATFLLAVVWWLSLSYYAALARVKWKTALEIETRFALRPFTLEYDTLKSERQKRARRSFGLIARERMMPLSVLLLSGGYLAYVAGRAVAAHF